MEKLIRVGIVDDHPGVRVEIRNLLANAMDILIVGEGTNGEEAIQLADQEKPDVLLLDVELPIIRGDEVVQRLRGLQPEVKVLAISSYDDPMYIQGVLENGAAGYIMKDEAPRMLLGAIHSILKDQVKWVSPRVAKQISRILLDNKDFSGHEIAILRLIVLGESDEEIMSALDIDEIMWNEHLQLLMGKFGTASRQDLKGAAQKVLSTTNS